MSAVDFRPSVRILLDVSALNQRPEYAPESPVAAGEHAAAMLGEACRGSLKSRGSAQLEVVRDLALDLERQLGALAGMVDEGESMADSLVEAALACADLATLAVCNLSELSPKEARGANEVVHLAAGAVRELSGRIEAEAGGLEAPRAEYVMRDARSAVWRAELAARQVGGPSGGSTG